MHLTLSDYIVDLTQNSIEAGSSVVIVDLIERADDGDGTVKVYISDNGAGMDEVALARVRDPFFTGGGKHEKRKVGLGVAFLAQFIAQCGGKWDISSEKGVGTSLFFEYDGKNPDAPPFGNLASAVVCCMGLPGEFELKFTRARGDESYTVTRSEAVEVFGDINDAEALITLREYIRASEKELTEKGSR
ncbi:MAG: sensor histidine kinase [Chitinispirillales bacterium]|jgi:signal transduction histidine kinase|nr:sensor histidine kinase [Chitinispirillales bacterium]